MYRYLLIEECTAPTEDSSYQTTYGIAVFHVGETHSTEISHVSDITPNKAQLAHLIEQCNRLQLSPIHLAEIIDDFILSA